MSTITIVQLYPDELGVAGDRGNVLALDARLTDLGVDTRIVDVHRDDALPTSADLVVVGGGPLSAMRRVHDDLLAKAEALRTWSSGGTVFFAYGSGAELLGHGIDVGDGSRLDGIGIFPFATRRVPTRKVGYVVADVEGQRVVGFEDNASDWLPDAGTTAFARVIRSSASSLAASTAGAGARRPAPAATPRAQSDGVRVGASIATQLGGPLLPLNPALTRQLVEAVAVHRGIELGPGSRSDLDHYAERARAVMEQNAAHVFSRI